MMEFFEPQRAYSPSEVAVRLGVTYQTVWNWMKSGKIEAVTMDNGRRRIRGSAANKMANAGLTEIPEPSKS